MKFDSILVVFFAMIFTCCKTNSQPVTIKSGNYENILYLGLQKDKKLVTGCIVYNPYESDKMATQIMCKLLFIGNLDDLAVDSTCEVNLYSLSVDSFKKEKGNLTLGKDEVSLKIKSDNAACLSNLDFNSPQGATFEFSKSENYNDINFITANRSFLHSDSDPSTRTKQYLIKGDIVNISKIQGGYALIEFLGKNSVKGWIKQEDLLQR